MGCRLVLYEFPCLFVDDLTESLMSSGWMTKEGEGTSVLWSVHVLVQACCSWRKENRCRRKSGSGVWGAKKRLQKLDGQSTGLIPCGHFLGKMALTSAECLPTLLGHHLLVQPLSTHSTSCFYQNAFPILGPAWLPQTAPHCPKSGPFPGPKPWSQAAGPCRSASVREAPIWGTFLWKGKRAGWTG